MDTKIEYRVRPVTRYIVTKFEGLESEGGQVAGSSSTCGEFENWPTAYEVAYALCRADHNRLGYPPSDERIMYPDPTPPSAERSHPTLIPGFIIPAGKIGDAGAPSRGGDVLGVLAADSGLVVGRNLPDGSVRVEAVLAHGTTATVVDALIAAMTTGE